jgi:hypothetical protein
MPATPTPAANPATACANRLRPMPWEIVAAACSASECVVWVASISSRVPQVHFLEIAAR